jgi:plastocyanin
MHVFLMRVVFMKKSWAYPLLALFLAAPLQAANLQAEVVDSQGRPLANAVVSLRNEALAASAPASAVIDQRAQQFAPSVLAVRVGTAVSFPNSDNIRHHVYSFSAAKRFELRLYQGTPSEPVVFDTPGVVVLGCNIHDWMVGYVYVTDDPWFAVTDDQGRLRIDDLPAGRYSVSLWHPNIAEMLPQSAADVNIGEQATAQRFTLAVQAAADAIAPSPPTNSFGDAFKKAFDAAQ